MNLRRRMRVHGVDELREYLVLARDSDQEYAELVSALTIHTTSWFRERPHFDRLLDLAKQYADSMRDATAKPVFRVLSAGCSSGEEVYSMATVLESLRALNPHFDYSIEGWDIDPVSIEKATLAVYDCSLLSQIPKEYQRFIVLGQGRSDSFFTLWRSIRQRCSFEKKSLDDRSSMQERRYHIIFCRNVLIYFKSDQVDKIIHSLLQTLLSNGSIFLGHSEGIEAHKFGIKSLGNASYQLDLTKESNKEIAKRSPQSVQSAPKILVIDDSPIAKMALRRALEAKGCEVVIVGSLLEATQLLRKDRFDQAVIDLSLATKDHNHWVEDQRRKGSLSSVVVMGSTSGAEAKSAIIALEHGAQEFIDKRHILSAPDAVAKELLTLVQKAKTPTHKISRTQEALGQLVLKPPQLILVGASTGGTEALLRLLKDMPKPCPPVFVVQHIASSFAKSFAERLAQVSGLQLGMPMSGTEIRPHHLYMAWDDYHIGLKMRDGVLQMETSIAPPQHSVRPAVDYLFQSALSLKYMDQLIGILLTGMGKDGARGLLRLKQAGAMTFTQDEASSVVYGMPGEAMAIGASCFSGSPEQIRMQVNQALALTSQLRAPRNSLY